MTDRTPDPRWLMQPEGLVIKRARSKPRRPIRTTPPTCRYCGIQVWPGHTCPEESSDV